MCIDCSIRVFNVVIIKTRSNVPCSAHTQKEQHYEFQSVHSSVTSCLNQTTFTVEMLAYEGRLHTEFEVNHAYKHKWPGYKKQVYVILQSIGIISKETRGIINSCRDSSGHLIPNSS